MDTKTTKRCKELEGQIEKMLAQPLVQSMHFWRGDLRALLRALKEREKLAAVVLR